MKFEIQEMTQEKVDSIKTRVEGNSKQIDDIVDGIIQPYCKDLDYYVGFIASCLNAGQNPPTNQELEDFCMNLSTYIYFAGGMQEHLGIRDDMARSIYKEVYNACRSSLDKGTVADKDSLAVLQSQEEAIISNAYTRAYKKMKSKVEAAQEILQSCKKVLGRRMQEAELRNIPGQ